MFVKMKNPNLGADPNLGEITVGIAKGNFNFFKFFVSTRYQLFNKGNLHKINIQ